MEWYAKNGNFAAMSLAFEMKNESQSDKTERENWLTESQIRALYNECMGMQPITDALIAQKVSAGLVTNHPELPHLVAARLYNCMSELSSGKKDVASSSFTATAALDAEGAGAQAVLAALSSCDAPSPALPALAAPAGPACSGSPGGPGAPSAPVAHGGAGVVWSPASVAKSAADVPDKPEQKKPKRRKVELNMEDPGDVDASRAAEYGDEMLRRSQEATKMYLKLKADPMQCALCGALNEIAKSLQDSYSTMQDLLAGKGVDPSAYVNVINASLGHMNKFAQVRESI